MVQTRSRKWSEFRQRYRKELSGENNMEELRRLAGLAKTKADHTDQWAADEQHNHAVVLKELLDELT